MRQYILTRIDSLQQELESLKHLLIAQDTTQPTQKIRLKGIWKGAQISDELFQEVKASIDPQAGSGSI